jgi:hypothetical protein
MLTISAVTPFSGLTDQLYKGPTFGRDKSSTDDSYTDKVSLSDGQTTPELTYQHLAKSSITSGSGDKANTESSAKETKETKEDPDRLSKMMQQVLDAKTGIDRKKLEEIEEKIEALTNKEGELTKAEQVQLELLQKQKEQLLKEAAKKLTEQQS